MNPTNNNNAMENEEVEKIKKDKLGLNKERRKMVKPSEKFRNNFNFEWDETDDTSRDLNPL